MNKDSKVEDLKDYIDGNDLSSRAIQIEAIAKDQLESEFLKEEVETDLEDIDIEGSKYAEYEKALKDILGEDDEYVDAFENVTYLADIDGIEEFDLDDSTEELFPGVRILKKKDDNDDNEIEDEW
ncbi:MAG: hypothetical protein ACRCYE_00325 [Sarcina sp.]